MRVQRLMHGDRHPEGTAHGAAQRLPAKRVGGAVGSDDARGAARFRSPHDGADVPRVLDAGQNWNEGRLTVERLCERGGRAACDGDDTGRLANRAHRGEHLVGDAQHAGSGPLCLFGKPLCLGDVPRSAIATMSMGTSDRSASCRRCAPSSSAAPLESVARASSRKRRTIGFWRLAMRSIPVVIVPAVCYHH